MERDQSTANEALTALDVYAQMLGVQVATLAAAVVRATPGSRVG